MPRYSDWSSSPSRLKHRRAARPPKRRPLRKAAKSYKAPRTVDGQPDLQGVWNYATATPLERPGEFAGKQVLTDEEAAEFAEKDAAKFLNNLTKPADGVGNYNEFWYDGNKRVIDSKRTSLITDPADGRIPALTPAAQNRVDAIAASRKGIGTHEPTPGGWVEELGPGGLQVRCIMGFNSGPPMTPAAYNQNVQLFQSPGYVVILNEMIHNARIVPLDGRPHGAIPPVGGRLARPLGRRDPGRRYEELPARDRLQQRTNHGQAAPDRALQARRRRHPLVRIHGRGSEHLDAALDRRDADGQRVTSRCTSTPVTRETTVSPASWPVRGRKRKRPRKHASRIEGPGGPGPIRRPGAWRRASASLRTGGGDGLSRRAGLPLQFLPRCSCRFRYAHAPRWPWPARTAQKS